MNFLDDNDEEALTNLLMETPNSFSITLSGTDVSKELVDSLVNKINEAAKAAAELSAPPAEGEEAEEKTADVGRHRIIF